jgi:hypothetical protein
LARARARLRNGVIPAELRAEILESRDPAHARARRIFAAMDSQTRAEAAAPVPEVVAPAPDGSGGPPGSPAASDAEPDGTEPQSPPRLSLLTRLSLTERRGKVTLTLHAAAELRVGVVAQESGVLRLLVESAGALPAFLQARPGVDGLRVLDVRRGEDTVQIAVSVPDGWEVERPEGFSGGARVAFLRP